MAAIGEDLFSSVNAKLVRARRQAADLDAEIGAYAAALNLDVRNEFFPDRRGYKQIVTGIQPGEFPADIAVRMGECVHNLRSALDNCAFSLSRMHYDPPPNAKDVAFPICETAVEFARRRAKALGQMSGDHASLIETIQPYHLERPEKDPLLWLSRYSNSDKHRIPPLVSGAFLDAAHEGEMDFVEEAEPGSNPEKEVQTDVPGDFPVIGQPIMVVRTRRTIRSIKAALIVRYRFAVEIDGQILPVGLVTEGMIRAVDGAVELLRGPTGP